MQATKRMVVGSALILLLVAAAGCSSDDDRDEATFSSNLQGEWISGCVRLDNEVLSHTQRKLSFSGSDVFFARTVYLDPACTIRGLEFVESGVFAEGGTVAIDSDQAATEIDITTESVSLALFLSSEIERENQFPLWCTGKQIEWRIGVSVDLAGCDQNQGMLPSTLYTIYRILNLLDNDESSDNHSGDVLLLGELPSPESGPSVPENRPATLNIEDLDLIFTRTL